MEGIRKGESITTGVLRKKNFGYLLVSVDELVKENVSFSRIYSVKDNTFGSLDVDWLACSATVCSIPDERLFAVAQKSGLIQVLGGGEKKIENLSEAQKGFKRKPGLMREIRCIAGGRAYAVGTGRQAYRREAAGVWQCIDEWSQIDSKKLVDYSFESIDGFSEEEIYTVGWEGEIWLYNGKKWSQINSPTNLTLHKVKCAEDGFVYIGGKNGMLIRGRKKKWEVVKHERTEEDIWGLEWFDGKLYASTVSLLYHLDGDKLELANYGEAGTPGTCYHLSVADGVMWSIGAHDVMEFDGKMWKRIL